MLVRCLPILLGLLPAACSRAAPEPPTLSYGGLPREDTFVVQVLPITDVWDTFNNWQHSTHNGMGYEQLAVELPFYEVNGEIQPKLATGWDYNEDGTEMVLTIRQGVTFSDGHPLTIEDWIFTLDYIRDNAANGILNGAFLQSASSWEALDGERILFRFKRPDFRFHRNFLTASSVSWHPEPKHIWEGRDIKTFRNNPPVGTGPYRLLHCNGQIKYCLWQRRDDYWGGDISHFPRYVAFANFRPPEVSILQWEQGEFDLGQLPYLNYRSLMAESPDYSLLKAEDPCPRRVVFNLARPPMDDRRFRQALSLLIDRARSARLLVPAGKVSPFPWPVGDSDLSGADTWFDPASFARLDITSYDPERAQRLLAEAGYRLVGDVLHDPGGTPVQLQALTIKALEPWAYILKEDVRRLGIQVIVREMDPTNFLTETATGETWDLTIRWSCVSLADPIDAYSVFHSRRYRPIGVKANYNHGRYRSERMDQLIETMESGTPDEPRVRQAYKDAFDLLYEDAPIANLWTQPMWYPYYTRFWEGLEQSPSVLFGACLFRVMLDSLRKPERVPAKAARLTRSGEPQP